MKKKYFKKITVFLNWGINNTFLTSGPITVNQCQGANEAIENEKLQKNSLLYSENGKRYTLK